MPDREIAKTTPASRLHRRDGATIAYHRTAGKGPGLVFLGGFMSDMTGTKASFLEEHAKRRGRAFLRFDYFGHGESSGDFESGTIGRWAEDAVAALDALTEGPQVLVGSSMGGWLMLLAALARPQRVAGLVGIAAAPDFTEDLMWATFAPEIRETLERDGVYRQPSAYGEQPYTITRRLIEEGRRHLLLRRPIPLDCPVRLLHGMADPNVPWQLSPRLAGALRSDDVELHLVKTGDHRLSTPADLALLDSVLDRLFATLGG
ncbi:Pimeloyl-ACP methyl ester carboxylesterase [Tistlia consotensis]|uniref:Pimeloyl-ACP methyl ester carboxylesterase n=1 Tax=Tistlia consotensis USBA 355 TaxID=560819 RepID=A0A1Y6BF32_9PROT|nr:alpha/beta hydrolase [Tistlia consotensis]SMF06853.1 Pimeloyl-ACP methyl ester carboxylesterase [Tistlia consotensis USBA 355]SNR36262.1 Pimeloyl-ACP methyl ester carboxylesterase [Tistlia consotensis]